MGKGKKKELHTRVNVRPCATKDRGTVRGAVEGLQNALNSTTDLSTVTCQLWRLHRYCWENGLVVDLRDTLKEFRSVHSHNDVCWGL